MTLCQKLNIELSYDIAIPLLGIYPKELKAVTQTSIYTLMFIVALFTVAKRWKQPKGPSMDKWTNKIMIYIYNRILFSLKKGISLFLFY